MGQAAPNLRPGFRTVPRGTYLAQVLWPVPSQDRRGLAEAPRYVWVSDDDVERQILGPLATGNDYRRRRVSTMTTRMKNPTATMTGSVGQTTRPDHSAGACRAAGGVLRPYIGGGRGPAHDPSCGMLDLPVDSDAVFTTLRPLANIDCRVLETPT
ncbi:unnamed protein product [Heligmosomoides polygyrus]|uniref:RES domain-containing protein n=1 Tax=Heligmosomoides polygyrus TaxID=6339 RepID=A0A183FSI0_HELPZ|nr:unnamed protein product [Heligmosomoides polygyrus]